MFTEEHKIFRQGLRDFLDREVMPNIDQWEEEQRMPKDLWPKFGEMGYFGLNYPEKYGGMDADFMYSVIFMEEISKCESGGFMILPAVQQYMASPYINKHGSEFLKEKYLTKVISGEWIACIGISEPGAGSDVANIQTKAIKDGDHYVVNGSKTFITNGIYGDFVVAVVKTNPEMGAAGVSLLIIDLNSEGIAKNKLKKLGWHASDTAELHFDNVKVPVENIIGDEGQGFYYLMGGLQTERLVGSIAGYASCEWALEYTLQYMSERQAFGRSINKFQVLRHRMAQLVSEVEANKQFVLHCARQHEAGEYIVKECSMAKLLSSELAEKVMTQCLQSFGGYGFMEDYKMARAYRDCRVGTIGGGSSEIMREIIAKMVIDDTSYQRAGSVSSASASTGSAQAKAKSAEAKKTETNSNTNDKKPVMSFEAIESAIKEKAAAAKPLGNSLKFNFGEQSVTLDGTGDANVVTVNDAAEAQCTVDVTMEDLTAMLAGDLNPMNAFMSGKIKVKGDMSVAMKLGTIMG
ncbi:MAG: alkylation response protein AidB-like acyl-CoA dehydrogenase/putative sterol carrier protein [Bacteroidia bacterium]|jgi:alkylation response protein AidB-like acyl-CoA dehydrogenase/putative sterol carrier protein